MCCAASCHILQSVLNNSFLTTGSPKSKTHQHKSITHSRWSTVDGYLAPANCNTSPYFQQVQRPSRIGAGAFPAAHHDHHVDAATGINCKTSFRRSRRFGSKQGGGETDELQGVVIKSPLEKECRRRGTTHQHNNPFEGDFLKHAKRKSRETNIILRHEHHGCKDIFRQCCI